LVISRYESIGGTAFSINVLALGVLVGLLGYTLFLALSTKEKMFRYFSIIMVLLTLLQTFSAFDRFLFFLTYNRVTLITHLLFITFLFFFEDFFSLKVHAPRLSRLNRISVYVIAGYTAFFLLAKALLPAAGQFHAIINFIRELFVFYTNILFLYTIVRAIAWRRTEALLILVAFIPPALLTSINALNIFAFMQRYRQLVAFLMTYNQPIGLSLQAILFSLAMGNRYNRIKLERQQSIQESERLRKLDAEKTEFFMDMSHELRTPLTIILGMTQQLRQGKFGDSIKANDRVLETIERNGMRLLRQTNHVLRLDRPKETQAARPFSPGAILQRIHGEFLPIARERHIDFSLSPSRDIAHQHLHLSAEDFETVLMNLLSNAFKFTPHGGSIAIAAGLQDDGGLCITVSDSGTGIAEEHREAIFNRYYRIIGETPDVQTGLGLPLVKTIMEELGGTVGVASTPGAGSTFTLCFPAAIVHQASDISEVETLMHTGNLYVTELSGTLADASPAVSSTDAAEVLVVEDNPDMCTYITSILQPKYRLAVVRSASEALRLLEAQPFALIISDIMMPQMDGHEFLSAIKRQERITPLIFLTARDSLEEKIESLREGALAYITKPFSAEVLLATVESTLQHDRQVVGASLEQIRKGFDALLEEMKHPERSTAQHARDIAITRFTQEHTLSEREHDIMRLILAGKSDKEIASELALSIKTVANHNRKLYQKVAVNSRFELIAKVFKDFCP
jgi:signal transduction histidine kinase/DNA-binding NarL/FixJ family response regulator